MGGTCRGQIGQKCRGLDVFLGFLAKGASARSLWQFGLIGGRESRVETRLTWRMADCLVPALLAGPFDWRSDPSAVVRGWNGMGVLFFIEGII